MNEPNPLRNAIDLITGQCFDETVDLIRTKLDQPELAPSDINPHLFAAVMSTRLEAMKATGTLPVHFRDALARAVAQPETPDQKGGQ